MPPKVSRRLSSPSRSPAANQQALSEAATSCVTVTTPQDAVEANARSANATQAQLLEQAERLFTAIQAKQASPISLDIAVVISAILPIDTSGPILSGSLRCNLINLGRIGGSC